MRLLLPAPSSPRVESLRLRVLVVLGCLLAAFLQRQALHPWVGTTVPYAPLFPMVVVAGWLAGPGAGYAVALIGSAGSLLIFSTDFGTRTLESGDYIMAVVSALQCAFLAFLCGVIRRVRAQSRVARHQATLDFENLADHAPGFVWSTQGGGDTGFVNQAWRTFTGLSRDHAVGGEQRGEAASRFRQRRPRCAG